ncbi:MAG: MFS transporter [Chloroflexota bacterium]|nr:MFS transporter [Chloroflexota bacterium]
MVARTNGEDRVLTVLRQRDFSLLWLAGLISLTGDWMLIVALPVTVYELTGSALATGGVLIANRLPSLVLGSVAGVFVDRWDCKRTMVVANLVRAPILLLLVAVDSAEWVWIVYVVAFAVATMSQFFRPAENALLPRLVGEAHLMPANALNSLNDNLSRLVGPALGGLVAAWSGLGGVAAVDAASFLVAAGMIAAIAAPTRPEREPPTDAATVTGTWAAVGHEWLAGLRLIRDNGALRVVFGVIAISSLGEGVMGTAFWVYVDEALHGGTREAGWLMSAQAVGGLVGAVVIGARGKSCSPVYLLGWGSIGLGLIDLTTFTYPAFFREIWPGLVLMAIVGVPATAFGTGYVAAIQTEAADAYRGRVFGALSTTMALLMIVGAVIAGAATERLGAVSVLTIDSLAYVAAGAFALRTLGAGAAFRVRRVRHEVS